MSDALFDPLELSLDGPREASLLPSQALLSSVSRSLAFGKPLTFLGVASCHLIIWY